jgi:peptidoglycan/LPS O-acetylase OafA/YrhL
MRPIKQAGVVSTHSILAFAPVAGLAGGSLLMLLHVTREAFLFVSACMLTYSYQRSREGGLRSFYWRRFVAVGAPYLCWTFVYFLVMLRPAIGWKGSMVHLAYLAGTGYYQLYYLLVIMQFYALFPLLIVGLVRLKNHPWLVLAVSGTVQLTVVSLQHWGVSPPALRGFWATREITSYQFYLVAGVVVALHLDRVDRWLREHVRLVLGFTVLAAAVAEGWYFLAAAGHVSWLGSSSDAFQPIVMPFNIGAIASIYLAGTYLVDAHRSGRLRAAVRSGSDNSYGVYLAQMVFILALTGLGWGRLDAFLPWPLVCLVAVVLVFGACVALTSILARTPLAKVLTGRSRSPWDTWLPRRRPVADPGGDAHPVSAPPFGTEPTRGTRSVQGQSVLYGTGDDPVTAIVGVHVRTKGTSRTHPGQLARPFDVHRLHPTVHRDGPGISAGESPQHVGHRHAEVGVDGSEGSVEVLDGLETGCG